MTEEEEILDLEKKHIKAYKKLFHNKNDFERSEILCERSKKLVQDLILEGFNPEQISLICHEIHLTFIKSLDKLKDDRK